MKTNENPGPRYNGILKKETRFDQFINWFKKAKNWIWQKKLFILISLLIYSNIKLINNPKIEKWQFDHHTWPPLVVSCFFAFIYALWIGHKRIVSVTMAILIAVCFCVDSFYYYPLSISIGVVIGLFIRAITDSYSQDLSEVIEKTGP